mgnify:FL=1
MKYSPKSIEIQKDTFLMHAVFITLALLTVTGISSLISRIGRIPVPLPLIQIGVGAIAALAGLDIGFDPDMFLLLFIPPLLYADAYRMPMREFGELRNVIIMMALGLVVFCLLYTSPSPRDCS